MAHPTRFERVTSTFGGQRSIYAASRGMARSTKRKNRVLRAPATNDSCETNEGGPEGPPFAFLSPFRRDRVLRVPATKIDIEKPSNLVDCWVFVSRCLEPTASPSSPRSVASFRRWGSGRNTICLIRFIREIRTRNTNLFVYLQLLATIPTITWETRFGSAASDFFTGDWLVLH
jgi:hypothetical protein